MKPCPRCNHKVQEDQTECPNCGVLFAQWDAAHPSSPTPVSATGSFTPRHQKYLGVVLVILSLVLFILGARIEVPAIGKGIEVPTIAEIGWLLSGIALALYAKGSGRSLAWGLLALLPFLGPLIGLLAFARNKKLEPKTGMSDPERSLIYVVIVTLPLAILDAFLFGQGAISFILCVAGVLYFLPRAIAARQDVELFKLRLSKAAITSVAGFAALGMIVYGNVIARERAEKIIIAVEQFQAKYGRYPDQLGEVVPEFIATIPRAKYVAEADKFKYFVSDSRHSLMYTVMPPFGRRIYTFEDHKWRHLD